MHTRKVHVSAQSEGSQLQARKRVPPRPRFAGTLIIDISASRTASIVCCLNHLSWLRQSPKSTICLQPQERLWVKNTSLVKPQIHERYWYISALCTKFWGSLLCRNRYLKQMVNSEKTEKMKIWCHTIIVEHLKMT